MHDIDWDWRPGNFRPPFTIVFVKPDEYRIMADADPFEWEVASIRGCTQEDAMRLLDVIELRYETEVLNG